MRLEGKVALITGSARGLGRACAVLFAREGAKIVVADIKDKEGNETVKIIKEAGGEAVFTQVDLSKMTEVKQMVKRAVEAYGRLDIFFHNAAIPGPGFLDRTTEEEYDLAMAVNLKAALFGAKHAVTEMRKIGGGCILFTTSAAGSLRPNPQLLSYSVSKAGLVMLAKCLAYYVAKDNIRVNCILPGVMKTPGLPEFASRNPEVKPEEFMKAMVEKRAIKRFGTVEEVARAALFLVSPEASWITAIVLPVDGGTYG